MADGVECRTSAGTNCPAQAVEGITHQQCERTPGARKCSGDGHPCRGPRVCYYHPARAFPKSALVPLADTQWRRRIGLVAVRTLKRSALQLPTCVSLSSTKILSMAH